MARVSQEFGLSDPQSPGGLSPPTNSTSVNRSIHRTDAADRPDVLDASWSTPELSDTLGQRALHCTRLPVDPRSGVRHGRESFQLEALESNTEHLVLADLAADRHRELVDRSKVARDLYAADPGFLHLRHTDGLGPRAEQF